MRLSTSLLFTQAARHRTTMICGIGLVATGLLVLAAPTLDPPLEPLLEPIIPLATALAVSAALLILLVGLAGAALAASARVLVLRADDRLEDFQTGPVSGDDRTAALKRAAWPAGWPLLLVSFILALAALVVSWRAMRAALPASPDDPFALSFAIAAFVACFPLVVVERHLAALSPDAWPEAASLSRFMRVLLVSVLCLGVGRLLLHAGFGWGRWAPRIVALLVFAVGAELALRTFARFFVPFPVPDRALGAVSDIAGLLRLAAPSASGVKEAIRETLGIDVSQSWALGFLRRAFPPAAATLVGVAWLLTGVIALQTNERAIYERFGRPHGVLGPGLHVILPWPAGQVKHVELGVMHDLPLGLSPGDSIHTIERGDDRLWDRPHPGDATYLIASKTGDQQGFQVVDIDMRIVWRVGESDAAALAFAYDAEKPETVIRGLAGRLLATRFAGSTLPAVLVEDRSAFIAAFRAALQGDCDALGLGVAIAAVIVEAIHPPAGAAAAYHAVQASELQARVAIAQAHGAAIETEAQSRQDAKAVQDAALVSSAEIVATAKSESRLFDADLGGWTRNGAGFLLERRLQQIGKVLPTRQLIIVDHRLAPDAWPLLDLRGTTALP